MRFFKKYKFTSLLFSLVLSFFFCFSNVFAYSYTLNPSVYSIFEDSNFSTFIHNLESNYNYFIVFYTTSNPSGYKVAYSDNPLSVQCDYRSNYGGYLACPFQAQYMPSLPFFTFTFPNFVIGTTYGPQTVQFKQFSDLQVVIYTNFNLYTSYNDNNTVSDGTYSLSFNGSGVAVPSIYDFYKTFYNDPLNPVIPSPTPEPDNYPILTEYYNIFSDRLTYLVEGIYSNYLYLSIFVIFIFYITVLLFWRLRK